MRRELKTPSPDESPLPPHNTPLPPSSLLMTCFNEVMWPGSCPQWRWLKSPCELGFHLFVSLEKWLSVDFVKLVSGLFPLVFCFFLSFLSFVLYFFSFVLFLFFLCFFISFSLSRKTVSRVVFTSFFFLPIFFLPIFLSSNFLFPSMF